MALYPFYTSLFRKKIKKCTLYKSDHSLVLSYIIYAMKSIGLLQWAIFKFLKILIKYKNLIVDLYEQPIPIIDGWSLSNFGSPVTHCENFFS